MAMVLSTEGSPTNTFWKRRSSAGDQAADTTFRLVKQGGQQVSRLDVRIVVANRAALGLG
jgi:hypothetical protein